METNQKPWKTMETNQKPWKTMKLPWKTMETNQKPWKTMKLPWKTMEVMIFCYKHTDKQTLHHYIYIIIIIIPILIIFEQFPLLGILQLRRGQPHFHRKAACCGHVWKLTQIGDWILSDAEIPTWNCFLRSVEGLASSSFIHRNFWNGFYHRLDL